MDHVSIPGPFKFFHTYNVAPLEVSLPIVASAHMPTLILKAIIASAGAVAWFLTVAILLWSIATFDWSQLLIAIPVTLIIAALGVGCVAITIQSVRFALNPKNQLAVTADDAIDQRQNVCVAWNNVRHMSVHTGRKGWHTVQLDLHVPIQHRQNLFDLRPRLPSVRMSDRILIGIRILDKRPYVLVHTMAALVHKHGGSTAELSQWEQV